MINVQVNEKDLLDLLMQRVKFWVKDANVLSLYKEYLRNLIDWGCFEGVNLDVSMLVDNLYINDTQIMDKGELKSNGININNSEKVLVKDIDNDLYLVSTY